jgi:hypothetical protein
VHSRSPLNSKTSEDPPPAWALALIAEIRSLRETIEQQTSSLRRVDRVQLAHLLPVLGATFGSELFTVAEVFEADSAGLRLVCEGFNEKKLGQLLARAKRHRRPIAGLVVTAEGKEGHVILWKVAASL